MIEHGQTDMTFCPSCLYCTQQIRRRDFDGLPLSVFQPFHLMAFVFISFPLKIAYQQKQDTIYNMIPFAKENSVRRQCQYTRQEVDSNVVLIYMIGQRTNRKRLLICFDFIPASPEKEIQKRKMKILLFLILVFL